MINNNQKQREQRNKENKTEQKINKQIKNAIKL